tara:strand:+ start:172 stop:861 length:690 start_codon:yes stop_codon:yes gene_type:complete
MIDVLILCGGFGTRFNISNKKINKPLVIINRKTILERIIEIYQKDEKNCRFIILGGYRYKNLKKYIDKNFKVKNLIVLNTGSNTPTAGRILLAKNYIKSNNFCLTYGDSLTNFSLKKALKLKNKKNFIISSYKKKSSFGQLSVKKSLIKNFNEKKTFEKINAGFYIFDKKIFEFIKSEKENLETTVFKRILKAKYKILEFEVSKWFPMDTLGNKLDLENILKKNKNYFK